MEEGEPCDQDFFWGLRSTGKDSTMCFRAGHGGEVGVLEGEMGERRGVLLGDPQDS